MISAWWLFLIVPASAFAGMLVSALLLAGSEIKRRDDDE